MNSYSLQAQTIKVAKNSIFGAFDDKYTLYFDFDELYPKSHLSELKEEHNRIQNELRKAKDLDAIMLRRKLRILDHQIKNHKILFPEEYV